MSNTDVIDYGPLKALIGTWKGDNGMDVSPEPDDTERNPYYETITYEPIGDVTNAESQDLHDLQYRQIVQRKSNDKVFHDESGYWMWDPATGVVAHSLVIPRAVGVLAGGKADIDDDGTVTLRMAAAYDDPDWGIIQSPFMRDNARTTSFFQTVTVAGDTMSYSQTTTLDIYGKEFEHTDQSDLVRVA